MKNLRHSIDQGAKYFAEHIGCANTRPDLAQVLRWLESLGLERTEVMQAADVGVLHTCAFESAQADRSVQRIAAFQAAFKEDAVLLVVGCLGDIERDRLVRIAAGDRRIIPVSPRELSSLSEHFNVSESPTAFAPVTTEEGRVRIRISRGCENRCSFCAIPFSQGSTRSLPVSTILEVMEPYYRDGWREFVLASEDAGAWGKDMGMLLPELLWTLARRFEECRFILTTINPHWALRYLADLVQLIESGHLVPHLYCPAQSGSTAMLRRMRRGYTAETLDEVYGTLLAIGPSIRLFQDILVGFPGETRDDFEASERLLQRFPPFKLRTFCWAPRPGTPAANMPQQIDPKVRAERTRELATEFLHDWFHRSSYALPRDRIKMIFSRATLPVASNIPLFGLSGANTQVSAARPSTTLHSLPIIG